MEQRPPIESLLQAEEALLKSRLGSVGRALEALKKDDHVRLIQLLENAGVAMTLDPRTLYEVSKR